MLTTIVIASLILGILALGVSVITDNGHNPF